jgi:sigma-B regulation protein RsbQ
MPGVIERNNVLICGSGKRAIMLAHGFGCDQNMWRFVAPAFEKDFMTVVVDHVGAGGSDLSAYDPASLHRVPDSKLVALRSPREIRICL